MTSLTPQTIRIAGHTDSIWCSRQTVAFAEEIGFSGLRLGELAIAVSELVTNVVKFASTGTLILQPVSSPSAGIRIIVEDEGPGIEDIQHAVQDGFSEGRVITGVDIDPTRPPRGLGAGLGAVSRLMDHVTIENKPEGGARVTAIKYLSQ